MKVKKPNHLLRRERELRGWSQKAVAQHIGTDPQTVTRWETGENKTGKHFQTQLCKLFDKSAQALGFMSDPPTSDTELEAKAALFTGSQEQDKEIDRLIIRKLARLHNWVVDGLEDGTQLRWQLYYTSRNSLTENGLLGQIARLEQLVDDSGDQQQRVSRILAQNYQLAGSVARDRFQYAKALEFFQKAEKLHEDTQLPDLTAAAIARRAVALLRKDPERYLSQSLTLYRSALDEAKHAEPHTQAYVFSHHAEALARKGDYDACIESLDRAETLLNHAVNIPIEEDVAYVRLSLQSLVDTRGECYVLLGKPERGLEHLQTAQKKLNQKMSRNNCRLLMQQSEAYLAAGQPDACVQQALKGLEVARTLESTSNIYWADEILAKLRLSAFRNESVVDELYEAVRG